MGSGANTCTYYIYISRVTSPFNQLVMQDIIMQIIASLLVDHLSLAHTINYFIFFLCFHMVLNDSLLFMSMSNKFFFHIHFGG
jgi:hypothetical protein